MFNYLNDTYTLNLSTVRIEKLSMYTHGAGRSSEFEQGKNLLVWFKDIIGLKGIHLFNSLGLYSKIEITLYSLEILIKIDQNIYGDRSISSLEIMCNSVYSNRLKFIGLGEFIPNLLNVNNSEFK